MSEGFRWSVCLQTIARRSRVEERERQRGHSQRERERGGSVRERERCRGRERCNACKIFLIVASSNLLLPQLLRTQSNGTNGQWHRLPDRHANCRCTSKCSSPLLPLGTSTLLALNTFSMSMFHFLPHDILHCIRLTFFFALSIPLDTRPFESRPPYTLTR